MPLDTSQGAEREPTSMDDSSFTKLASETLASLTHNIEDVLGDRADIDLQDGILTIDLDEGGRYVVNKHLPNRQIWLSSPLSGAAHFAYDPRRGWVTPVAAILFTRCWSRRSRL